MLRRNMLMIAGLAGTLAACNGWPKAIEKSQAESHPEKYPTYAAAPAEAAPLEFGGRHWAVSPGTESLTGARLQSVGNAASFALYAPAGGQPPYDVLFTPAGGNKWRRVLPIE